MKAIIRQGTLADKIILVMLECGIISGRAERIIYIPSLRSTVSKTIGYLKANNIVSVDSCKGDNHSIMLNTRDEAVRKRLIEIYGIRAVEHHDMVTRDGRINKNDKLRWERARRMSEIVAVMQKHDFTPYTYEKFNVPWQVHKGGNDIYNVQFPHFFSYREIRKMMSADNAYGYTRVNGIFASEGGLFVVYNYGKAHYSWNNNGEQNTAALLNQFAQHYYEWSFGQQAEKVKGVPSALAFGSDMSVAQRYLLDPFAATSRIPSRRQKDKEEVYISPSIHERVYKHLYFIPLTPDGVSAFRILALKDWREKMRDLYHRTADAPPDEPYDSIYVNGDTTEYIYFFFCCDIHKLYDFLIRGTKQGVRKVVQCYTWQRELVERTAKAVRAKITIYASETETVMDNFADAIKEQEEYMKSSHYDTPRPKRENEESDLIY